MMFTQSNIDIPKSTYWYQSHVILKVWEAYAKLKNLKFLPLITAAGEEEQKCSSDLLIGDNKMILPPSHEITLLLKTMDNENTQPHLQEGEAIVLCDEINPLNIERQNERLARALRAIQAYSIDKSTPNNYRLIFPLHIRGNHWNLGIVSMEFDEGRCIFAKPSGYEPKYNCFDQKAIVFLKQVIEKTLSPDSIDSGEFLPTFQQVDESSCGAISAENGKQFIDHEGNRLLEVSYGFGAKNLRQQHIQEVNCPRFTEILITGEYISLRGMYSHLRQDDVNEKMLVWFNQHQEVPSAQIIIAFMSQEDYTDEDRSIVKNCLIEQEASLDNLILDKELSPISVFSLLLQKKDEQYYWSEYGLDILAQAAKYVNQQNERRGEESKALLTTRDYLLKEIEKNATDIVREYNKLSPDYEAVRNSFFLFSWRINELSWSYKYNFIKKNTVSEEAWHLFDFIASYLAQNPDMDLSTWEEIANECHALAQFLCHGSPKFSGIPHLTQIIHPLFSLSYLKKIKEYISLFGERDISISPFIDYPALLGLLMVIGESAERLEGLASFLPENMRNVLNIIKDIRDSLEKKLPSHLFNAPDLMNGIFISILRLEKCIALFIEGNLVAEEVDKSLMQASGSFKQLFDLLEEKPSYSRVEQARIFFHSLAKQQGEQAKWLEQLRNPSDKHYSVFLFERLGIDYAQFKSELDSYSQEGQLNLTKEQKDKLVSLAKQYLARKKKLSILLKMIRDSKTKVNDILQFLEKNNLSKSEFLKHVLPLLTDKSDEGTLKNKKLLMEFKQTFYTLDNHRGKDDFDAILFDEIAQFPYLLNLDESQKNFIASLNGKAMISDHASLDNLFSANKLEGREIDQMFYEANRFYPLRPYHKKFKYPQMVFYGSLLRIVDWINKLIRLLVQTRQGTPIATQFYSELMKNQRYLFALQLAIKAFGGIVKDTRGDAERKHLLKDPSNTLLEKHLQLLEFFQNQLAHRASEVNADALIWFALYWAMLSYPEFQQHAPHVSTPLLPTVKKNRQERVITKDVLNNYSALIISLAEVHGFMNVRAFGHALGCPLGIQTALNLIVGGSPHTTAFELQWQLHFVLGWTVTVFTEESLNHYVGKTISERHLRDIHRQAISLIDLQQEYRIKTMVNAGKYHEIRLKDQTVLKHNSFIDFSDFDFKNVEAIVLAAQEEDFDRENRYRQSLLQRRDVKSLIIQKAQRYVGSLFNQVGQIDPYNKECIFWILVERMELNQELDLFYKAHLKEIQDFDLQISRFDFRYRMQEKPDTLPPKIQGSDLAKRSQAHWNEEVNAIREILNQPNGQRATNLLNTLHFLLEEVHNPEIPLLLYIGKEERQTLVDDVCQDFCQRFLDLFEEEAVVHFDEVRYFLSSGMPPVRGIYGRYTYLRIPFYAEILEEISLPLPILSFSIERQVMYTALNIQQGYRPFSKEKKMTTDTLFIFEPHWEYRGKVQKLSCRAITFDYPPTRDFDQLLEKKEIKPDDWLDFFYPHYNKDKKTFNEFQEAKAYLDQMTFYEKRIKILRNYESTLKRTAPQLNRDHDEKVYSLNSYRIEEIKTEIQLFRTFQIDYIHRLLSSSCIQTYCGGFFSTDFKKKLSHEIMDWVYGSEISDDINSASFRSLVLREIGIGQADMLSSIAIAEVEEVAATLSIQSVENNFGLERTGAPSRLTTTQGTLFNSVLSVLPSEEKKAFLEPSQLPPTENGHQAKKCCSCFLL